MATAKKFKIAFYNDQWIQIGNFIYIFNFYEFDIGKIFLSDNRNLREKIEKYEDIEEFKTKNFDSFIIIQLSVKFIPTLLSSWRYENILDYQGFKVDLILDDQPCLGDLNDELEQIDDKVLIDISFMWQVDFDSIEGQRFLSIIENKRLGRLIANEHKHSQQSVLALLRFLKLPNNKMNALEIKVGETALIPMIFDSLENNLFIEYLEILSKAKVDNETELKAIEFIGKRIGWVIVLNSNNKLIRPMKQRQVHKYY